MSDLRKKNTTMVGDLEEQLEALKKAKSKSDKDNNSLNAENSETAAQLDDVTKAKVLYV